MFSRKARAALTSGTAPGDRFGLKKDDLVGGDPGGGGEHARGLGPDFPEASILHVDEEELAEDAGGDEGRGVQDDVPAIRAPPGESDELPFEAGELPFDASRRVDQEEGRKNLVLLAAEADEGDLLPVRGPVPLLGVLHDLVGVVPQESDAVEGSASTLGVDEQDGGAIGGEAREVVGSGGDRHLAAALELLEPDARLSVPVRREGDGLPIGTDGGGRVVAAVGHEPYRHRGGLLGTPAESPKQAQRRAGGWRRPLRRQAGRGVSDLERSFARGFSRPRLAKGGFEGEGEVPRRLETLPRFLLQAVLHDALQRGLTVRSRWPRSPAAPPSGSPTSCRRPCPSRTPSSPRAARRGSPRTRRCPSGGRRAARAPARATCSPPSP